jgi:hypothetical protein
MAFETILYGLVLAHAVIGFSQMIYHRKTIKFYWGHILACLTIYFIVIQIYYSLFWVTADTVQGPWSFFFLRILPLTLQYIITYQLFPEKVEGLDSEKFLFSRIKEILLPMVLYNMISVCKTVYYRYDEYMELGDGKFYNSSKFALFVSPALSVTVLALLMIFFFQKKRLIEAFIVFSFVMTMLLMTFGATSK